MTWFIFAILSGFFFALARVIARVVLKKEGDTLAFTAIHDFIAGLVLLPFIVFHSSWPHGPVAWLYFAGVVIFAFACDWLAFMALNKINISVYQIVGQVRHIFTLLIGFFLFSEAITIIKLLAIFLIIFGVIITLYEKKKISWSHGIQLTVWSTLLATVAFMFDKYAISYFPETQLASLELISIGILGFIFLKFNTQKIINEVKINKWGLLLSGSLFGLFEMFLFFALKTGEISKVIPVTQVSLVFGVLIGILFLKEKERIWQKLCGMTIIMISILMLNYF